MRVKELGNDTEVRLGLLTRMLSGIVVTLLPIKNVLKVLLENAPTADLQLTALYVTEESPDILTKALLPIESTADPIVTVDIPEQP